MSSSILERLEAAVVEDAANGLFRCDREILELAPVVWTAPRWI